MYAKKLFLSIFVFLLFPIICFAEGKIIINEFLIDPQPQSVELFNAGDQPVDISGWIIDDNGGSSSTYIIAPETKILPNSCLVFSKDFNLNKSSSDSARLFDSSMNLVDSFSYKSSPGTGVAFARIPDAKDWSTASATLGLFNSNSSSCLSVTTIPTSNPQPTATPTVAVDPSPTNTPTPIGNVYINEAMVNPGKDKNEWVELYNGNEYEVNLVDWYLDDGENVGSTPKKFSIQIPPYGYKAIAIESSLFNNDGDSVRLLDFNKFLKNGFEYENSVEGKTYGRTSMDNDEFCIQEESFEAPNNSCINESPTPTNNPTTTAPILSPTRGSILMRITPIAIKQRAINRRLPEKSHNFEEILGESDYRPKNYNLEIKYLSLVSLSYSLLTLASVLIKMTIIYAKRRFVFPPPFHPS